jgi:hypothetical protein
MRAERASRRSVLARFTELSEASRKSRFSPHSRSTEASSSSIPSRTTRATRESTNESDGLVSAADQVSKAYRKRLASATAKSQNFTDELYSNCVCLRSIPLAGFVRDIQRQWVLPITSANEDRLLALLGLPRTERDQIEGLQVSIWLARGQASANQEGSSSSGGQGLTESQLSSRAIARLASNPPQEVGAMQRRTAKWLLRPL